MAVDTPEELDSPLAAEPERLASHLAADKARAAAGILAAAPPTAAPAAEASRVLVAFDTIVVHGGRVIGKPRDVDDARRMLRALSGQKHQVVTGVAILPPGADEPVTFAVDTNVRMKELDEAAIDEWMARGEFMGCAGAYNIEGQVAEVEAAECFQNVAGLPLCHLYRALSSLDLPCDTSRLRPPLATCDKALARTCWLGPTIASS
jgi:septum formation protein